MRVSDHNTSLDLWTCARTPESTPALAQLLRDGAPPDDRNDFGETALHIAATHGNNEAVQLLLCYNANLLVADWESGWTPLHRSLYHQQLSTSLFLIRHALTCFGKTFLRSYLHETLDHAQQSPMELLTARLHKNDSKNAAEICLSGFVYTFGKRDYQVRTKLRLAYEGFEMLTGSCSVLVTISSWDIICQMEMYK
ncbi:hypothetical protein DD238_008218 [Peronospora effusa]|uniref:Uncharacterized protein n=1 Tax=Peronospora effusa TaxID=542832 RepID=A0A3M6VEZ4_9STRA|nr:hypothetical protein DD238_008218 [Peronospora effusa]RQM11705.1 hypothetical protein DD237_008291 [Peronospora effusa]